jgi:hypothetical protein
MPPRAPVRVVENPRIAVPLRFRAELHRAAHELAVNPMAAGDPNIVRRAHLLVLALPRDNRGAERKEIAALEYDFAAALLRTARAEAWRDWKRHRAALLRQRAAP